MPAMETGVTDHVLSLEEVVPSRSMPPRTLLALCRPGALRKEELSSGCKPDCEDALLILPGRKRIRSEPSSALNQVNNEHNDGNHEQKMDQTATNVADKAQKPEHHQDDNYSPEHRCFFRLR
jgi:hypothetical protein